MLRSSSCSRAFALAIILVALSAAEALAHCFVGPRFFPATLATVGKDISSATQGSSVASVAGKKRGPTKQCARASAAESATKMIASANAREQLEERSMNNLH